MKVILVAPRGFCAGVNMAVNSLEQAICRYGTPLYVYHEIVHNSKIVEHFENKGVTFIDNIDDVPKGSCLFFSAHGISPRIRERAVERRLFTIDATCPLVQKVHDEAAQFAREGYTIFLIGHAGHDEIVGTLGVAPENIQLVETESSVDSLQAKDPDKTAYITQTTFSIDDVKQIVARLRDRFPNIISPAKEDICYATQNRQNALKKLIPLADVVLVVGSLTSSNSKRLVEVAQYHGLPSYLLDGPRELDFDWFTGHETVLITAGASAPEESVQQCVKQLKKEYDAEIEEIVLQEEKQYFPFPVELRNAEQTQTRPILY